MRIPRKGTSGRIIVDTIFEHGPLTMEQGLQIHRILGLYLSRTREAYNRAHKQGWLTEDGGVYSLSESMKACLNRGTTQEKEAASAMMTPPRMPRPFKPLALARLPNPRGWRQDTEAAREPHFFNGSVMQTPFRGAVIDNRLPRFETIAADGM